MQNHLNDIYYNKVSPADKNSKIPLLFPEYKQLLCHLLLFHWSNTERQSAESLLFLCKTTTTGYHQRFSLFSAVCPLCVDNPCNEYTEKTLILISNPQPFSALKRKYIHPFMSFRRLCPLPFWSVMAPEFSQFLPTYEPPNSGNFFLA